MFIKKEDYDKLVKRVEELEGEVNGMEETPSLFGLTCHWSCFSGSRVYDIKRDESIRYNLYELITKLGKEFDKVNEKIEQLATATGCEYKGEETVPPHFEKAKKVGRPKKGNK